MIQLQFLMYEADEKIDFDFDKVIRKIKGDGNGNK